MGLMHASGNAIAGLGLQEGEGKPATGPPKTVLTCYELWEWRSHTCDLHAALWVP